jgi:hypothetical protein
MKLTTHLYPFLMARMVELYFNPTYVLMAYYLTKHRNKFTFTFLYDTNALLRTISELPGISIIIKSEQDTGIKNIPIPGHEN